MMTIHETLKVIREKAEALKAPYNGCVLSVKLGETVHKVEAHKQHWLVEGSYPNYSVGLYVFADHAKLYISQYSWESLVVGVEFK